MRYFYVQNGAFPPSSGLDNARVLGDNLSDNFGLRELLMALLDEDGKKRLGDQQKTNDQRFTEYDADLRISFQSTPRQLSYHRWLIAEFRSFLGEFPPTEALATQFMATERFGKLQSRSLDRYYRIVKRFMERQCGVPFTLTIQKTRSLPEQVETANIDRMRAAIAGKRTHRATIPRDLLLVDFDKRYGLRAEEMANLVVKDLLLENRSVHVRGKGNKDRVLPLTDEFVTRLREQVKTKRPSDSVFDLTDRTISNKLGLWGRKSGSGLHAHSLRHYAAEQMMNAGAGLEVVQDFLGHESPETTRVYLAANPERMREAVERVASGGKEPKDASSTKIDELLAKVDKLAGAGSGGSQDEGTVVPGGAESVISEKVTRASKALTEIVVSIGDVKLNAADVLAKIWSRLSSGLSLGYFLSALMTDFHLEAANPNAVSVAGESLIAQFNLHQIVAPENRLEGHKQVQVQCWALTELGKAVVLKLRQQH